MIENRTILIFLALTITESAWIFALSAVLGLMLGVGGSPIGWPLIAAVFLLGMVSGRLSMTIRTSVRGMAVIQAGIGLIVVYLLVATRRFQDVGGADLLWPFGFFTGALEGAAFGGVIVALVVAVLMWRRALAAIAADSRAETLRRSFQFGMVVIAAALLTELFTSRDLGARMVLFPFFGAGLAGLALARLAAPGPQTGGASWARIVAGAVALILAAGFIFGLVGGTYGLGPLRLIARVWGLLVEGVLWVLQPVLWVIFIAIEAIIRWLQSLSDPEGEAMENGAGEAPQFEATGERGQELFENLMQMLQYPLAAALIITVFAILVLAFRRVRGGEAEETADRESIRGDADAARDLASLLAGLLPSWLRGGAPRPRGWRYPQDEPGITEMFRLYFAYVTAAVRRGMTFNPNRTPVEQQESLGQALPGAPVPLLTDRFNAACYGRQPTPQDMLGELESGLAPFMDDRRRSSLNENRGGRQSNSE